MFVRYQILSDSPLTDSMQLAFPKDVEIVMSVAEPPASCSFFDFTTQVPHTDAAHRPPVATGSIGVAWDNFLGPTDDAPPSSPTLTKTWHTCALTIWEAADGAYHPRRILRSTRLTHLQKGAQKRSKRRSVPAALRPARAMLSRPQLLADDSPPSSAAVSLCVLARLQASTTTLAVKVRA